MNIVYFTNFSRSEYEMHVPVFKVLFPSVPFRLYGSGELYENDFSHEDVVVVSCMAEENAALSSVFFLRAKKCRIIMYAERLPSVLFLTHVRKFEDVSLLFCPETNGELEHCARTVMGGKRYVSKAAQDERSTNSLGRFVDYDSLNELNRQLMFSVFEGLSLKETAALTGKSVPYIQTGLSRLKEKFGVLEKRELFVAMMRWIGVSDRISQAG